jgi:hypothetical protein
MEERLRAFDAAKAELEHRERQRPRIISQTERDRLLALGPDLAAVWHAATTTPRDRKELLRPLIEEVIIKVDRDKAAAHLTLRWKGGALNEIDLALPRSRPATIRTDEDTIALVRRLADHYPDSVIAGVLNRQGRSTAYGHRFIAGRVGNLRRHWDIPCFEPTAGAPEGELLTIKKAAVALGVAPSTIHRLLNDGIIAGDGRLLPQHLKAQVNREIDRLELLLKQIKAVEAERDALLVAAHTPAAVPASMLLNIRGIGPEFAAVLWSEGLFRHFDNRRQVAAYAGLAPTPWQSGAVDREQGVSKAGNPRLRTTLIQLAWLWLRNQPHSALTLWFHERVSRNGGRLRKTTIVALARKLLVALWKYVTAGVVIEGAAMTAA